MSNGGYRSRSFTNAEVFKNMPYLKRDKLPNLFTLKNTKKHFELGEYSEEDFNSCLLKDIEDFEWSPDGLKFAFIQSEDKSEKEKKREDKYGGFAVEDREYGLNQLWVKEFKPELLNQMPLPDQLKDSVYKESLKEKLLLDSLAFSINSFKALEGEIIELKEDLVLIKRIEVY